jgi:hypothetical protein
MGNQAQGVPFKLAFLFPERCADLDNTPMA